MTTDMKQVEVGKSPKQLPVPNVPWHARPKNPYVTSKNPMNSVCCPYVVTSTPTKSETLTKNSVTLPKKTTSKQYSLAEFHPAKKNGIDLFGTGTKSTYIPEVLDLPSTHRAVVPYARNPYASACVTHMSQQKVLKHPNIASTGEFVPTYR
eukprot:4444809-Ditylum_brightwellii.AAC.1